MSNVFLFDTRTERDSFIMGSDYTIPHVSGLVDSEEITYNNRLVPFLNKIATYHNDDELVAEECRKAVELSKNNLNFDKCILIQRVPITETQTDPDTQEEIEVETGCDYEYVEITPSNGALTSTQTADYKANTIAAILCSSCNSIGSNAFVSSPIRFINVENIISFGTCCFQNCTNLNIQITFSNNLGTLGERAFSSAPVTLSSNVITGTTLHLSAFQDNTSISNLTLNGTTVFANGNCGNHTGTLIINATNIYGQNNNNVANQKAFKHIVINGNLSLGQYCMLVQGDVQSGCLESVVINGNFTTSGSTAILSYDGRNYGSLGVINFNFVRLTGVYSGANGSWFYTNNTRSSGNNMVIHLSKTDDVSGAPSNMKISNSLVAKVYIGDGSSLSSDETILQQYVNDSNWTSVIHKLDTWYSTVDLTQYTRLTHLVSNGLAWLDTGIAGADDLEIKVTYRSGQNTNGYIYGNYVDDASAVCRLIQYNTTQVRVSDGNSNAGTALSASCSYNVNHTIVVKSGSIQVDATTTELTTATATENTTNICLGNRSVTNPNSINISLNVYRFSIKKNNSLVLDLIPVIRNSDDTVGFWDNVSNTFMPSSTEVAFTAGIKIPN